ncbi:MAG: WecB/TagA/CpsF family glycosyltransferase, partial [Candidatus Sumerlaeota bacterium]
LTTAEPATVEPRAAAYLNAHTVNLAFEKQPAGGLKSHRPFRDLLQAMDVVYTDGMAVVKEARRRKIPVPERVSAADFFLRFLWASSGRGRSVALVGGTKDLAGKCGAHLRAVVPSLHISLTQDGFFEPGSDRENALIERLKEARPAVVLLGMGSPQQEAFALRLRDEARLPTIWCVGALFEYFTPGHRRHAPLWMREWGLEWLYRLAQEPRRLSRRYLIGNLEFFFRCRTRK